MAMEDKIRQQKVEQQLKLEAQIHITEKEDPCTRFLSIVWNRLPRKNITKMQERLSRTRGSNFSLGILIFVAVRYLHNRYG
jgi:hypothetical protein